jgi:conjugal transfer pilus assembly protein TraF
MRRLSALLLPMLTAAVVAAERHDADVHGLCAPDSMFWCDSRRGWHFYEDPPAQTGPPQEPSQPRPPTSATSASAPASSASAPEIAAFERLQRALEHRRTVAVMSPTEANVRRYMELEAQVVMQASRFADVAQRIAWSTPALDMTLQGRPVNALALDVFERDQQAQRGAHAAALARDHVLLFFFRSDCPYCHAFGPVLQAFEARYGIQVVPISIDGAGLPAFRAFRRDNGIARTLNVTQVPTLFLAQPFVGTITPLGAGVLSESQLLERLAMVTQPNDSTTQKSLDPALELGVRP